MCLSVYKNQTLEGMAQDFGDHSVRVKQNIQETYAF